ncbi:MAG: SAM-dependent methyltransferase [Clostridiales bacterium]|nr:SAM-dependent methyltransferase [Clostridiales bacterium]
MERVRLDNRLKACASLVRGGFAVDIGTDHAYVPIYLIQNHICTRVVASDVRMGPVQRAQRNIEAYGLAEVIQVVQADGLQSEAFLGCSDVIIAGMGGDLIAKMIDQCSWSRQKGVRYILQPMSKAERLRFYLWNHGYEIIEEMIAYDEKGAENRVYQILCCTYTGKKTDFTEIDLLIGKHERQDAHLDLLVRSNIARFEAIRQAKACAGEDAQREEKLIKSLGVYLS